MKNSFVVEGEEPGGPRMIKSLAQGAQGIFLVHHKRASPTKVAEGVDDLALRHFASSEHAWFSIDLLTAIASEADALRFIAKALVHLAPPDAAYVGNATGDVLAFDKEARRVLTEGNDPFSFAC